MATGTLRVKLRPLRLGFLIKGTDPSSVLEAIQTNSFLWGGVFNPILPVFSKLPARLKEKTGQNASTLLKGYLDAFDPDFIVRTGKLETLERTSKERNILKCSEILAEANVTGLPSHGIGIFELWQHFREKELKFVRAEPLEICLPRIKGKHPLFLASLFGQLSQPIQGKFEEAFLSHPGVTTADCTIDNYWKFLKPGNPYLTRMGRTEIIPLRGNHRTSGDCVFLMDADSAPEVIDFWNLRALGWRVFPVPKQMFQNEELQSYVAKLIDSNSYSYRDNPNFFNETTILKGQSVTVVEMEDFGAKVNRLLTPVDQSPRFKASYQMWYPRIWDGWAREKDGVGLCQIEVQTKDYGFSTEPPGPLRFECLVPPFASRFSATLGPRCANEVDVRIWGSKIAPAEVIPEGDWRLANAAGAFGFSDWRCSKSGLVHYPSFKSWAQLKGVADADPVFIAWFQDQGWKIEPSDKGRIAKQMLKQMGGVDRIGFLTLEGMIDLLGKLSDGRTMNHSTFRGEIRKLTSHSKFDGALFERLLRWMVESQITQLGLEVQCPHCRQRSWHSLKDVDYSLKCSKCLEEHTFPDDDVRSATTWAYRLLGPFSLPRQAYGVYSVLITLRFFANQMDGALTPMLSFNAVKAQATFESDLAMFFSSTKFGVSAKPDLVFVECKTFNAFESRDATRMMQLGDEFPGAVLVFATLRRSLSQKEQRLLRAVANRGRRRLSADQPFNPVVILTAHELFADEDPWSVWREMGGTHAAHSQEWGDRRRLVALADDTQQIYLRMPSWHQWTRERMHKRQQARKPRSAKVQSPNGTQKAIQPSFPVQLQQVTL